MNNALNLEKVSKTLGNRHVLKEISFGVETGDIFGYLGPNGAGKTTTIRILLGLLNADSGNVTIKGREIGSPKTRQMVGFALDPDGLYDNMTAEENLGFYARIYQLSSPTREITRLLEEVGLKDRARDKVGSYSKGMRQRLSLARAMVHNPQVLILDEPTAGVDPTGQIEVRNIIKELTASGQKTVFLSSHNLDEVQRICNRIAIIDKGQIKAYGQTDYLRRSMGKGVVTIETGSEISPALLNELQKHTELGYLERKQTALMFAPPKNVQVSDIINWLTAREVRIEAALRSEATLEEMYSTLLKEAGEE
jgi:ABC-2 type transport system ATP-binding protein